MVLLTTPSAVELLVFNWEGGCGQPISARLFQMGIFSLVVIKSAPDSVFAAKIMTNLIIWDILRIGPFHMGADHSQIKICVLLLVCVPLIYCGSLHQSRLQEPCFWRNKWYHPWDM